LLLNLVHSKASATVVLSSPRGLLAMGLLLNLVQTKTTAYVVTRATHAATPMVAAQRDIPVAATTQAYAVDQASFAATSM
jgi:hypothetical protein